MADDACRAGLYNHIVANDRLEEVTQEIAGRIITCSPDGIGNAKYQLNLLAMQSALTETDQASIRQRNRELLDSPATRQRIAALLASVRKEI
jgi:enoyl-CoA hydratase/carnithine racemase